MKYLMELSTYDKIIDLKKRHSTETEEIDKIKDYKTWKVKNDRLFKSYLKQMNKLVKDKNPYALKGDMNAKYLYHYTDIESCYNMILDNEMISGGEGISFTTHPNLYKRGFAFWYPGEHSKGRHDKNTPVKMKFDFSHMKNDGLIFQTGNEEFGTHAGEEEIRYLEYSIDNIIKYIKEIIIIDNKIEEFNNYDSLIKLLKEKNIRYKIV